MKRAAKLATVGIVALVDEMELQEDGCIVAVDGSLYEKYPNFHKMLEEGLAVLGRTNVQIHLTKDGSGNGAAIAAATHQ